MKRLLSILASILCLTSGSYQLYGVDDSAGKKVYIVSTFQMKVLYDGQPCDDSISVSLKIYNDQHEIKAKWVHAYYKLFDERGVGVRIQHFTTSNDTITNLEVGENSFHFTLYYDIKSPLKIAGTEKGGSYHVVGIGKWWDNILEREVNIKWYSIDTIPYYHKNGEKVFL